MRARSIRGRGLFLSASRLLANITVAEGAEGPSSGFEVIGRELAEIDEGRSQEAMDNFFA